MEPVSNDCPEHGLLSYFVFQLAHNSPADDAELSMPKVRSFLDYGYLLYITHDLLYIDRV